MLNLVSLLLTRMTWSLKSSSDRVASTGRHACAPSGVAQLSFGFFPSNWFLDFSSLWTTPVIRSSRCRPSDRPRVRIKTRASRAAPRDSGGHLHRCGKSTLLAPPSTPPPLEEAVQRRTAAPGLFHRPRQPSPPPTGLSSNPIAGYP